MILSDRLTRDEVRKAFSAELTYRDVLPVDVRALEGYIAVECARHDRFFKSNDGLPMMMHPSYRKKYEPRIEISPIGQGIYEAYLRVDGRYWQGREAISFNDDGFIGFAGWADDDNVQPFLRAFAIWLKEWMGCKRVFRKAAANAAQPVAALAC